MIRVDIVTPSRRLIEGAETLEVKVPSSKGELQILPGHTELLTLLGPGVLSFPQDGKLRKFAISYGFAEVKDDKVLILAETCEEATDVNIARAKQAQSKAEQVMAGSATEELSEEKFKKYQLKLERSIIRQSIT